MTDLRVATFWAGDLLLAVDVNRVQEVVHSRRITPVPLAHPCVTGLLNLRGQIVTAIDARRRLGLAEREPNESTASFIIQSHGVPMSLVVDREGDVVDLDGDLLEVPQTVDSAIRSLVTGVHKLDGTLVLLVDVDHMLLADAG
jgi:purine-binding chemotaxis protein CheW